MIKDMAINTLSSKYYPKTKDAREWFILLWPLIVVFIMAFTYAIGFRHPVTRTIMLYLTLIFPLSGTLSVLSERWRLNYTQIDSAGIHITILGFIRKHIYWSDVSSIGPVTTGDLDAIGVMYVDSFNRRAWSRKIKRKKWGWDEVLAHGYTVDEASLRDDIARQFKKYLRVSGKEIAEIESEEVTIEPVFQPVLQRRRGLLLASLALPLGVVAWGGSWSEGVGASVLSFGIAWCAIRLYETGSGGTPDKTASKWLLAIILLGAVLNFMCGMCLDAQAAYSDIHHLPPIEVLGKADFWLFFTAHLGRGELWSFYILRIIISLSFAILGAQSIMNILLLDGRKVGGSA